MSIPTTIEVLRLNIEEQVELLRLHLGQVVKENQFNLQHPRVIEMSKQLN
ncbi:Spo0E family sporulation regulatory protein-aspartic acid phosphatase [Paenibacillus sp. V4I3]